VRTTVICIDCSSASGRLRGDLFGASARNSSSARRAIPSGKPAKSTKINTKNDYQKIGPSCLAGSKIGFRESWSTPSTSSCTDDDALQAARAELQSLAVPLVTSPSLHIRLTRHQQGDVVMLNLYHAAGDGIASIAWVYADPVPYTPLEQVESPAPSDR